MKKKNLFSLILILGFINLLLSQTLNIHKTDGSVQQFNLSEIESITLESGETETLTDIDGNTYKTVKIGDQVWMAENLKVTHYRNGDPIHNVTDDTEWSNLTTGAYCNYDNADSNVSVYGRLYNWYAVNDNRNIAPAGWHVPTDEEWIELELFLGMSQEEADTTNLRGTNEGGKLKETGTVHWNTPNEGATNEYGFTALPNGNRNSHTSNFLQLGYRSTFYTLTEFDTGTDWAWYRTLGNEYSEISRKYASKRNGWAVRCIKD